MIICIEKKGMMCMSIKEARERAGLTREELSIWLGIPYRTLQNWETGSRKCPDYVERLIVDKIQQDYHCLKLH